jgi:uncharacterized protein DUF1877
VPRAVLFAITDDDLHILESATTDDERVDYVQEVIEERWEPGFVYELDKAWDALHRALNDGQLEWNSAGFPLSAAVLGKVSMNSGDDYLIGLTSPDDVPAVADALAVLTVDKVRRGYEKINPADRRPEFGPEDLQYTLDYFAELPTFWKNAASAGRAIIFTVSQ